MNDSVLLVEDEEALRMTVGDPLRKDGYVVDCAANGDEAFEKATQISFGLIILDLMLPRRDGFTICRDIHQSGLITPILMLTARVQTADKVKGLRIGADDYVTKPFNMQELMARVEALLRRVPSRSTFRTGDFQFDSVRFDVRGTELTRDGKLVNLSAREFQLLRYIIEHAGTTLSRDELLKEVWGYSTDTFTRTVDVHVASLRQKLENDPKQPQLIVTVLGIGYKFRPSPPSNYSNSSRGEDEWMWRSRWEHALARDLSRNGRSLRASHTRRYHCGGTRFSAVRVEQSRERSDQPRAGGQPADVHGQLASRFFSGFFTGALRSQSIRAKRLMPTCSNSQDPLSIGQRALNTRPARSLVSASTAPLRAAPHHSGPM